MKTQGLFDPCACTSQDEYCTTELCLSVDKLKKKKKQTTGKTAARKRLCWCTDVTVYVLYNLSHVKTEQNLQPCSTADARQKAVSCHHRSFPFVPPSAISRKHSLNFFASALVRNPSRCFVKRSAVLFFVSTRLTDLQDVFCVKKIDQLRMLLHLDFSTIFIVCFSIICRIVTIFDCRHVLLGGMSPSSTMNARCPATGIDGSTPMKI